jgi:toxin HigB-1
MIQSWKGKEAAAIFRGDLPKGVAADIAKAARRRLLQLDGAAVVDDLKIPPSNRLHKIGADLWSISVNMQFRVTFRWGNDGPEDVWFGDYH